MKNAFIGLIFLGCFGIACNQKASKEEKLPETKTAQKETGIKVGTPIVPLAEITKSFISFWSYFNRYGQLTRDYPVYLNEKGEKIDKGEFLNAINDGKYLPLMVQGENSMFNVKLAQIPKGANKDIRLILMNYANRELIFYHMEGKPIPEFNFTDINGKVYTSANTKGKIILFKCWFITCVACVQEMPALNQLVEKYKDRKDILFISLAIDDKKPLQEFLAKTKFDYVTVPNQEEYMEKKLHVQAYPSHFIINKQGIMVKSPQDESELDGYITQELAK